MTWSEFIAEWIADCRIWSKLQHEWGEKILERVGHMCQFCGTAEGLEVTGLNRSSVELKLHKEPIDMLSP